MVTVEWKRVHFVGIGGYGMSALARVLLESGIEVTGSDIESNALVQGLLQRGARVKIGHAPGNVGNADALVYSSSITRQNVEIQAARAMNLPILHRSELLARLLNARRGIAVAGAHGKTTTSAMIAQTMVLCGLDPTYVIGGEVVGLRSNARAGKGAYVVAEADESDGTFLAYYPHIVVITNIEADHLENYGGDFSRLREAYRQFLCQMDPDGLAVLCVDDEHTRSLVHEVEGPVVTYAARSPADYVIHQPISMPDGIGFQIFHHHQTLGTLALKKPGIHNAANALAAAIVCLHLGLSLPNIAVALQNFSGAKRRFQLIGEGDGVVVIDDYAHHPTEIQATLQATREWQGGRSSSGRLIVLFQPQRYSRTALFMDRFAASFALADQVLIAPIYAPPGEQPLPGVTSERLVADIVRTSNAATRLVYNHSEAVQVLSSIVRPGDVVLVMGAGDIWRVASPLVQVLQERSVQS